LGETDYREAESASQVEAVLASARKPGAMLAVALESSTAAVPPAEEESTEEPESEQMELSAPPPVVSTPANIRVAVSAAPGQAISLALDDSDGAQALKQALADDTLTKTVHDSKSAMHALAAHGVALSGVQHDPLLYVYLLDP